MALDDGLLPKNCNRVLRDYVTPCNLIGKFYENK